MNEQSSIDLLGYLLGALETDEHQQMERLIEQDPELKEELNLLRSQLAPLDELDPPGTPRAGLARRTCEFVASQPAARFEAPTPEPTTQTETSPDPAPQLATQAKKNWGSDAPGTSGRQGRNTIMDLVVVAAVLMLMAAILLPMLNNNRFQSRMLACQDNMRTVGMGLLEHASNSGGQYVTMSPDDKLAFAGIYAPKLLDTGYVENPNAFMCAGVDNAVGRKIPTLQQIIDADESKSAQMQKTAGGDFAYIMGRLQNGQYSSGSRQNRSNYILLADNPDSQRPDRASSNHGGYGQNVFFEDGRVDFLKAPVLNGDFIYQNDRGGIGPGTRPDDIVLVPSDTRLDNFSID